MNDFNAVAEIRALAARAKLANHTTAFRALKIALEQVQEVALAKIPNERPLTEEEMSEVLGAESE